MARLFLSAAGKSSGKTTVAIGLGAALAARGLAVQAFKKGPDYIDPMWLAKATGRPCYNLDFNTQSPAEIVATLTRRAADADFALIEGNKGLHDGVDLEGRDSSAALAKLLAAPVVLVIDAFGMARGVAPLVLGYAAFDPQARIAGIVLNRVGASRQETKLRQALERYTDIPVLGALPREPELAVRERHLGLTTPAETEAGERIVAAARAAVENALDLDRLLLLARAAAPLAAPAVNAPTRESATVKPFRRSPKRKAAAAARPDFVIAVPRDAAFGFYYPDDLEALKREGAELAFFDALADARLPDCDGLFIGGGFPETQAARLAANAPLRDAIREALAQGLPAYAECGGLMVLSRSITWRGERHAMVGAIEADAVMRDVPQGRGLVALEETEAMPWGGPRPSPVRAHEFHYAALENLSPDARFAYTVTRGVGIDGKRDGLVVGNLLASFAHLRHTAANPWASRFAAFVRAQRRQTRAKPHCGGPSAGACARLFAAARS